MIDFKIDILGRGIIAKYSSSCYGISLTLDSHKHHLHAKYKYGGASKYYISVFNSM